VRARVQARVTLHQRARVSISGFLRRTHRRGCCGKEGFNDSRSCVDLRPLKHIECALYVCKLGQALRPSAAAPWLAGPTRPLASLRAAVHAAGCPSKTDRAPSGITTFRWRARCTKTRVGVARSLRRLAITGHRRPIIRNRGQGEGWLPNAAELVRSSLSPSLSDARHSSSGSMRR